MEKVYIKHHPSHAGKWIYKGYHSAWKELDYDVSFYNDFSEIEGEDYYLMAVDSDLTEPAFTAFKNSKKTFLFVRPTFFPRHWGTHPNFCYDKQKSWISRIKQMPNVLCWSFCETTQNNYFSEWGTVHTIPLAFDHLNYKFAENDKYKCDVCFIGGWANNGFDEKRKIMLNWMRPFVKSGLKCGFYVNRAVSHEFESLLLANSTVSINIHDAYQQELGLDTNERSFKSLGLNGLLVSDNIRQIEQFLPQAKLTRTPEEMLQAVLGYIEMDKQELRTLKEKNRNLVCENHTYMNRVEEFVKL